MCVCIVDQVYARIEVQSVCISGAGEGLGPKSGVFEEWGLVAVVALKLKFQGWHAEIEAAYETGVLGQR